MVEVYGKNGLIGRGEIFYSSEELSKALGKRSEEVKKEIIVATIEVIHRDNWVQSKN